MPHLNCCRLVLFALQRCKQVNNSSHIFHLPLRFCLLHLPNTIIWNSFAYEIWTSLCDEAWCRMVREKLEAKDWQVLLHIYLYECSSFWTFDTKCLECVATVIILKHTHTQFHLVSVYSCMSCLHYKLLIFWFWYLKLTYWVNISYCIKSYPALQSLQNYVRWRIIID